ncbi:uncharacterized protein RSE6_00422 [Rhynchosporium secalis]|uniref:Uncharacterized protein n=1 Tax=Rhynchosporium secalis TaxID=38038 RepID=A0A1E1LV85_RHYSE|nr:uncharacterized protein RSE6_00422 [Rhynchosporium secalis]
MAIIWGLDLREIQWRKFKGSHMFSPIYHLQKTKMIVYQIAMILCVCSESVGTASLSDYVDQQDGISRRSGGRARIHNNDIVGIFSYNIFVGIAVATIFGSGFFFDLFWPERRESLSVKWAWKISSVVVSIMALADAVALTVIVATYSAHISGVSPEEAAVWFQSNPKPDRVYRHYSYNVGSVVLLWPGVVASFASTYIMWKSIQHNDIHGPKAAAYRMENAKEDSNDAADEAPIPMTAPTRASTPSQPYPGT